MSSTTTKSQIGSKDIKWWDGKTRTFTRLTSTGGSLTLNALGYGVDVLDAYGAGDSYTDTSINSATTAIGSTTKTALILQPGTWVIDANTTIGSNFEVVCPRGTVLSISTGVTLTINGPLSAGAYQIFSCAGTGAVVFGDGGVSEVYPEWWGAIADDATDCTSALNAAHVAVERKGIVKLTKGTYQIASKIVWKASMIGSSRENSIIKNTAGFSDTIMLDVTNGTANYQGLQLKFLRLDANSVSGVACIGYSAGTGSATASMVEGVEFRNVRSNHAVKMVDDTVARITGSVFMDCAFWNCDAWVYLGNNADDLSFIGCRFNDLPNQDYNGYPLYCSGENHIFQGCFFHFGNLSSATTIKALIAVSNAYNSSFKTCFFETASSDIEYLFYINSGHGRLPFHNININFDTVTSFVAFVRLHIGQQDNRYHVIDAANIHDIDGTARDLVDVYVPDNAYTDYLTINISGCGTAISSNIFVWNAGSTTKDRVTVRIFGNHRGIFYRHGYKQSFGSNYPTVIYGGPDTTNSGIVRSFAKYTDAVGGASPRTRDHILPREGVWLVTAIAKKNSSDDHMITATYKVVHSDSTTDIFDFEIVGTEAHSGDPTNLTMASSGTQGTVQITFTFGGAAATSIVYIFDCQLLAALDY